MNAPSPPSSGGMMSLEAAARLLGAAGNRPAETFRRVTTDSRRLEAGDLFVALRGERFDGHAFVAEALQRGAMGAVVEDSAQDVMADPGRLIRVPSTPLALASLAAAWRDIVGPRIIAVTGSNGKTTVKEMLSGILRNAAELQGLDPEAAVLATEGNLNNTLGLPMTLLRLRASHRWAVVEMGTNHAGEIAAMTQVARPDVALITNVQRAHVGLLGGMEAVARAKAEIFEGLPPTGVAVIPAGTPMTPVLLQAAGGHKVVDFWGQTSPGQGLVDSTVRGLAPRRGLTPFVIQLPGGEITVQLNLPGQHNFLNAVAAAAGAFALGIDPAAIQAGLERFRGVAARLESKFSARGALVIDDTYNANPDSVLAAIEVLAARPGRKILVLGDLGELGEAAAELHREVGRAAREAGIDDCFTLGEMTRETGSAFGSQARHFESREALVATLKPQLNAEATVLVKGSRFMEMERVVEGLVQ